MHLISPAHNGTGVWKGGVHKRPTVAAWGRSHLARNVLTGGLEAVLDVFGPLSTMGICHGAQPFHSYEHLSALELLVLCMNEGGQGGGRAYYLGICHLPLV